MRIYILKDALMIQKILILSHKMNKILKYIKKKEI